MIDVFKIGVHVGMTSNAPQMLAIMLRHLTGVHTSVKQINSQFKTMAMLAGGAMAAIGGAAAVRGVWHVIEASRKLNDELLKTKQLGGEFAQSVNNGAARSAAFATQRQVGTFSASDLVRMQRELGTQMQNPSAAAAALPIAARIAASVSHYTGEDQETIVKNLIKVADIRGQIFSKGPDGKEHVDAAKLQAELNAAGKGLILGGNYLKSNDLLMMARQAGVPAKTMTQEGFYAELLEMAVSQGASRAGTATTSLFSQMVGGQMPVHTAEEMQRMGLISRSEWKSDHGHISLSPSATQRFEKALADPIGYITGPLNDLMTAKGMDQNQKLLEVFRLFGRQTTQRLVAEALSNAPQFARAKSMFGDIQDPDKQFAMLQNASLSMNLQELSAAWTSFMESLGSAGIPLAIKILQGMTSALQTLAQISEAHPTLAAGLLSVVTAIGTLAAIGGALTVVTVGLRGLAPALSLLTGIKGLSSLGGNLLQVGAALTTLVMTAQGVWNQMQSMMGDPKKWDKNSPLWRGVPGAPTQDDTLSPAGKWLRDHLGFGGPGSGLGPNLNDYLHKESYRPGASGGSPSVIHTAVYLDGRVIARAVSDNLARSMSLPPSGTTGFDGKMSPSWPASTVAA